MNKKMFLSSVVLLVAGLSLGFAGTRFSAPSVNGVSNVYGPEVGDIVYDSNAVGFFGYDSTSAWQPLGGGAVGLPPGTILPYVGVTAPAGFLPCDGGTYARATYANLATALGCSGAGCAYGAADTASFNVPDLRGRFLRGTDNGAGNDPDANTTFRTAIMPNGNAGDNVGSLQDDVYGAHTHGPGSAYNVSILVGSGPTTTNLLTLTPTANQNYNTGSNGGNETRPKNVNVNYIIKY